MRLHRPLLIATTLAALAACSPADLVTRGYTTDEGLLRTGAAAQASEVAVSRGYKVSHVNVSVPDTLKVSEENTFFPITDIVWREDPFGDRRAQVHDLIQAAVEEGTAGLDGPRAVDVDLVLTRFHALTEKTRFMAPPGSATHDVQMIMTVRDAATGEVIEPARPVGFKIEAHTGLQAMADEKTGVTQRQRITGALEELMQIELG